MHVLIADALPPETRAGLEALGLEVTEDASLGSHSLPGAVASVDILVVGKTRVTRRTIDAAPNLKAIIRAGSGVETIDLTAANERGVFVSHCPAADTAARAELVLGAIIALDRGLTRPFPQAERGEALGLRGRSIGLLGYDATARSIKRVAEGLGMRVHVCSDALTHALAAEAQVKLAASPEELFRSCEVVSLHPEGPETEVLATAALIALMPPRATLINISRRGLIDLAAARDALASGAIRLALDVYDADDYGDEVPFAADAYPNLLATDRLASGTIEATEAIASTVVGHIEEVLATDRVPECVNLGATLPPAATLILRYRHHENVLAATFEALRDGGVHVTDVHTGTFGEGAVAFARVALDRAPSPSVIAAITRNPHVIRLDERS